MLRARQFSKKCRRNIRWMHVIQLHTIYFMKNEENQAERRHSKNFGIVFEAVYCHSSWLLHLNEVISYKWFLELLEMKFWIKKNLSVSYVLFIHFGLISTRYSWNTCTNRFSIDMHRLICKSALKWIFKVINLFI